MDRSLGDQMKAVITRMMQEAGGGRQYEVDGLVLVPPLDLGQEIDRERGGACMRNSASRAACSEWGSGEFVLFRAGREEEQFRGAIVGVRREFAYPSIMKSFNSLIPFIPQ